MPKKKAVQRLPGRPSMSSAAELTTTILDAASRIFLSSGFAGATMRQVAAEARVSPQTLYARFADKTTLYEALMQSRTTALLGDMEAPFREGMSPEEALQAFGVTLLSTFLGTDLQRLHRMAIAETATFPALARAFFAAGPERGRNLLIAYLNECVAAGHLRIDHVEAAAEQLIGSLVGAIVIRSTLGQAPRRFDAAEISSWVARAVHVFLRAYQVAR